MANSGYSNFVLETKFEDQYNTLLSLLDFCTVDNSLVGTPGSIVKVGTYTATNNKTQTLAQGVGNSDTIEVSYASVNHTIELLQNRFSWYDEEKMNDPKVVEKGLDQCAVDMFNTSNAKALAQFAAATRSVEAETFDFAAFVDANAMIAGHDGKTAPIFALCNNADVGAIRKALKDDLKYVEAFVRSGYIGTVAGTSIYTCDIAPAGTIYVATKEAITYFSKTGTEVEQEREENTRKNTFYSRKYGLFALVHDDKVVKLVHPAAEEEEESEG